MKASNAEWQRPTLAIMSASQAQPHSTRRALLLGATAPDLRGVEHDIELMTEALEHHRFLPRDIVAIVPANYSDIVDALHELVENCQPDDVIVIYYSGHGARSGDGTQNAEQFPFIVASDFEQSTEDDFRGYSTVELGLELDALTRKSKNVTVIMDCCHAGRMFREEREPEPERIVWQDISRYQPTRNLLLTGRWRQAAERLVQRRLLARRDELNRRHAEANPFVVQLLASSDDGRAYETSCSPLPTCDHRSAGAMTLALHGQLMAADPDNVTLTWQDVGRAVRLTPRRHDFDQRISIEGPYRRRLFQLDERDEVGAVDVTWMDEQLVLVGGRLLGLEVGDRFQLVNPPTRAEPQCFLAEAEIHEITSSCAFATTSAIPERLRPGAWALPVGHGRARAVVEITGLDPDSPEHRLLRRRLEASGLLRVGPASDALPLAARLAFDGDMVELRHQDVRLDCAQRFELCRDPRRARRLAAHLERSAHTLARRTLLERLAHGSDGGLAPGWNLSWSTVEHDCLGPALPMAGARLQAGQRFTIVWSDLVDRRYLSAFLLRVDGEIEWLSSSQSDGVEVGPTGRYMLGQRRGSSIGSVELRGPARAIVPTSDPLPTMIVIVISDRPIALRRWAQRGVGTFQPYHDPLDTRNSTTRNVIPPPSDHVCAANYHIHTIHFETLCNAAR